EGDEQGLDAGVGEILDDLVLGLRDPAPLPVLRQRLDVRTLSGDPLAGAGIAMQVDDSHGRCARSSPTFSATVSTSVFLETLPNVETGKSAMTSSPSRSLNPPISPPSTNATSSCNVSARPRRRITHAPIFSPSAGSGIATQATFCTAGCARIRFSISSALIFSPPRLMRSFFRPATTQLPDG